MCHNKQHIFYIVMDVQNTRFTSYIYVCVCVCDIEPYIVLWPNSIV
jgi:hypothetical protein